MSRIGPSSSSSSGGGLPGGLTKNPRLIPVAAISEQQLLMLDNGTTYDPDGSGFWAGIDTIGAYITTGSDGIYSTICDVTGEGYLFHVIPFQPNNLTDDIYIRITVDGVEHELQFTDTSSSAVLDDNRLLFGCFSYSTAFFSTAGDFFEHYGLRQTGTPPSNAFSSAAGGTTYMVSPLTIINQGMPCLYFEESLKVEVKCEDIDFETYSQYAGASYMILEA